MTRNHTRVLRTAGLLAVVLSGPLVPEARAQAFVPQAGEGTVAVVFQNMHAQEHFLTTTPYDFGQVDSSVLGVDVSYGLTNQLTVDFSLPFVMSKYTGPVPHQLCRSESACSDQRIDDGSFGGAFQDFRFALRYNVTRSGAVVTPFVGTTVPSHGYEYYGHSAVGRRLSELQIGVSVAKLLDAVVSGAFIQGRYSYGFAQRVLDIKHNRSNADLEIGYFVTPAFRVFVLGAGQVTHGGIDLPLLPDGPEDTATRLRAFENQARRQPGGPELLLNHDRIDRQNHLNVGGGASFSLTDSVDLFGSYMRTVAARNGHAFNPSLTLGVSWGFKGPRKARETVEEQRAGTLLKCLCQKTGS